MSNRGGECVGLRVIDLEVGQPVRSTFMAKYRQLLSFASKPGQYLTFMLFDRTGEIKAVVWDNGEKVYHSFEDGDVEMCIRDRCEVQQDALKKGVLVMNLVKTSLI